MTTIQTPYFDAVSNALIDYAHTECAFRSNGYYRALSLAEARRWRNRKIECQKQLDAMHRSRHMGMLADQIDQWNDELRIAKAMWVEEMDYAKEYRG